MSAGTTGTYRKEAACPPFFIHIRINMKPFDIALTIVLTAAITIAVSFEFIKSEVMLQKVNAKVYKKTANIYMMKTAISLCLQRNMPDYDACQTNKNGIPYIKEIPVSQSTMQIDLPFAELSHITLRAEIVHLNDAIESVWHVTCTGNKDIIFLDYFDTCDRVIYTQ